MRTRTERCKRRCSPGKAKEALVLIHCINLLHWLVAAAAVEAVGRLRLAAPPQCRWVWQRAPPRKVAARQAAALDVARRMVGRVYVVYIDLKTFFPGIDRAVLTAAELLQAVPEEVMLSSPASP